MRIYKALSKSGIYNIGPHFSVSMLTISTTHGFDGANKKNGQKSRIDLGLGPPA